MSGLGLGLGLGPCAHRRRRKVELDPYGELPATFSFPARFVNQGIKRINFSEPVTLTTTGGVTLSIDGTPYQSGDTIPVATSEYHTLTINNPGGEYGTITFGKRKQITYLHLYDIRYPVVKGDITGMKLTYLYLYSINSSVITGDITRMKLTHLSLYNIGSSVITGDITGMKLTLTYLYLYNLSSSVTIRGDITGMELVVLHLISIGSSVITGKITGKNMIWLYLRDTGQSLIYGASSFYITNEYGIRLEGNSVFATAAEYTRLIHDAATGTWGRKYPFIITAGTTANCPDWDTVKSDVAVLLTKAAWTIIPSAWLVDNDGTWPADWNEYEG